MASHKANDTLSLPRTMRHIAYLTFLKEKVMLTDNNDILKKYMELYTAIYMSYSGNWRYKDKNRVYF
jgi:hypothetical protein